MAYFARKLRYGACDDDGSAFYFALIELARKKGGRAVGFVLYRRTENFLVGGLNKNRTEMIRLNAETTEEAIRRFWPSDEEGMGSEFPGHGSNRWERSTLWLNLVATGGGYERFGYKNDREGIRLGNWARVGTPAPWAKRRKRKKPLQIGNLGHILLAHQARLRPLMEERGELQQKLLALKTTGKYGDYVSDDDCEEYELVSGEMEKANDEISLIYADIVRTKAEMRYKVRWLFPKPMGLIPKRVLRYERERKDMKLSGW